MNILCLKLQENDYTDMSNRVSRFQLAIYIAKNLYQPTNQPSSISQQACEELAFITLEATVQKWTIFAVEQHDQAQNSQNTTTFTITWFKCIASVDIVSCNFS